LVFHHRRFWFLSFALLSSVTDSADLFEDLKLFFIPVGPGADQREASTELPRLQWNRGGIGDSVLTILSSLALAVAIFFAHSVSLMFDAS